MAPADYDKGMSRHRPKQKASQAESTSAQRPPKTGGPVAGAPAEGTAEWAQVAQWYDQHVGDEGGEYHRHVILPGVLRILQHARSRLPASSTAPRVLDLACGQGVLCRRLVASGYRVVGVDIAAPLIEAARARGGAEAGQELEYLVGDATNLRVGTAPLTPQSYSAATIILAAQNLARLSPVWRAVRELLVPGGALVIVMMHPSFRIPQQTHWHWDDRRGVQSRLVESYLGSSQKTIETHPGKAAAGEGSPSTTHYHRPLQAYINTLGSAGLLIDHIEEWPSHKTDAPGPKQNELNRSRREIPLFMAIRAVNVGGAGESGSGE